MSTIVSGDGPAAPADPLRALCEEITAALDSGEVALDQAVGIDRIAALEQLCGAAAGMIAAQSVAFEKAECARQRAAGVAARDVGRGTAEQIGFARRMSPAGSARQLGIARSLATRWPLLLAELRAGRVSWTQCQILCRESRHLEDEAARLLDAGLSQRACGWSPADTERAIRRAVYALDPHGSVDRRARAEAERRVTLRPLPDAMAMLSALLPVEQGVAVYAALTKSAKNTQTYGDERTLDQLRADALIHRLSAAGSGAEGAPEAAPPTTSPPPCAPSDHAPDPSNSVGSPAADPPELATPPELSTSDSDVGHVGTVVPRPLPPPILVNMTISAETLLANSNEPAELAGYGPIPAELGRALAAGEPLTPPAARPTPSATPTPPARQPEGRSSPFATPPPRARGRALGDTTPFVSDGGVITSGRWRGSPAEPPGRYPDSAAEQRDTSNRERRRQQQYPHAGAAPDPRPPRPAAPEPTPPSPATFDAPRARVWLQRLLVDPVTGVPTSIDPRRREFTGVLRQLLLARDPHCTHPYCSAPTRHADHITPYAVGGATTLPNGQGLCAAGNYLKEVPGWTTRANGDAFTVTTPTGHRYRTGRGDPLGLPATTTRLPNWPTPTWSAPTA